uniref:Uncharacterized protein n=1 Tax=Romanomermis culicivorax TaxID=13658 RepID=A0A915IY33_ROMCU
MSASSVEDNFCGTCRKCTANGRGIAAANKALQNESSLLINSTNYDGLCTSGYSIVDDDCCSSLVDAISRDFAIAEFKKSSSIAVNLPSSRASVASSSVENLALTTSSRATLPLTSNGGNCETTSQPKESTVSCLKQYRIKHLSRLAQGGYDEYCYNYNEKIHQNADKTYYE